MNCPLHRDTPDTGRNNPRHAREAYCYQLHDQVQLCLGVSSCAGDAEWESALRVLETMIHNAKSAKGKL